MQRFDGGYDRRDARRQVLLVATIGLVLSTLFIAGWFHRSLAIPSGDTWQRGRLLSDSYDPPTRPVELYHNQGDGQLFVHQAQDPFVRHPEGIRGSRHEQAYRLQRPLYGWLGWLASRGRPDAVGWGLIALTVTSVAVLGGIVAAACRALGASALWGVTTYVAPGILENLLRCGPEALGTALVTAGVVLWIRRRPQPWAAVACFAVAGLCRESLLLVPLTLLVVEWWDRRPSGGERRRLSTLARSALAVSLIPYAAWVLVLRGLVGAWPQGDAHGRLSAVPFAGLARSWDQWGPAVTISFVLIAVPAIAALALGRDRHLKALVGAHLLLAASFGPAVWPSSGFERLLLPLSVLSLLALVDRRPARETGSVHGQVARRRNDRLALAASR